VSTSSGIEVAAVLFWSSLDKFQSPTSRDTRDIKVYVKVDSDKK